MALIGGGGAGNVAGGANPSGVGSGINYIGDHCYGNSGVGSAGTGGDFVALDFTSASNSYIMAEMFVTYDAEDLADGNQFGYKVSADGANILFTRREASAADKVDNPLPHRVKFVIPQQTRIVITGINNGSGVDLSFVLIGRVYA